jgi:hypothetical protein
MQAAESNSFEEEKIMLPGQTPEGEYILSVLVKRTYNIVGAQCERTKPTPLVKGDRFYGDPKATAVEFEADLIPFKLATDVIFIGKAYALEEKKVQSLLASVIIDTERNQYRKDILVIGDRECIYNHPLPSYTDPIPFTEMEICYDRAYGGVDIYSNPDMPCPYPRNPVGTGFVLKNIKPAVQGLKLPNIEDPKDQLTPERLFIEAMENWERQPMPQGLAWYCKYWHPRAALAGIMPADKKYADEMRKEYSKFVPPHQRALYDKTELPIIDFRFFNGASPGLIVPYLRGDEKISLLNLAPNGQQSFSLPSETPQIIMDIGKGEKTLEVVLHTLTIRHQDNQVDLVWRGAMPYQGPEWLPQMKKLDIRIS